ncbi:MAG: MarR family transcriptional regulator [Oscillochloridaceae bacterium]|nr:MarR family transcriptional regulator [Chloroflexaceae bacterium]MDW8388620.1 MarR family transcriptional regulator [Oscillochloridaceae bacterium]
MPLHSRNREDLTRDNAHRLLCLVERLRPQLIGPTFQRLTELHLSPSHIRLMRLLQSEGPLAMKELAGRLGISPPSVTALTRRLAATGLVTRRPHADDSRVVLLELTPAGEALQAQVIAEQMARMGEFLSGLCPNEQNLLLDLLERAIRAGEERLEGLGGPHPPRKESG